MRQACETILGMDNTGNGMIQSMRRERIELLRRRRLKMEQTWEPQHSHTLVQDVFYRWYIAIKLEVVEAQLKKHKKESEDTKMKQHLEELDLAIKHNDSAAKEKITRTIAKAQKGNRRFFTHFPRVYPLSVHVIGKYGKHGNMGGWAADVLTVEQILELEPNFEHVHIPESTHAMSRLYDAFALATHYSKNRKSTPPNEVPNELWRLCLFPQWLTPNFKFRWGVGSDQKFPEITQWHVRMRHLFETIGATLCLPLSVITNYGCHVPKKYVATCSPEEYLESSRSIHVYAPLIQNLGKASMKMMSTPYVPNYNLFCAVKGKRRDEAIGVQLLNQYHCSNAGLTWATSLYDVKNAFYCVPHGLLQSWYDRCGWDFIQQMFRQVLENHICLMVCCDTMCYLSPSMGVPPGLFAATDIFNFAYQHVLSSYALEADQIANMVKVWSLDESQWISSSSTIFVDDIASTVCTASNSQLPQMLSSMSQSLDSSFAEYEFKQNRTKQQLLVSAKGYEAKKVVKECGPISSNARYLGPVLSWNLSANPEIKRRIQFAWSAFKQFSKFWQCGAPLKHKRNVFVSAVLTVLIDMIHVFIISVA